MKLIVELDNFEDNFHGRDELMKVLSYRKYHLALSEIHDELFRPAFKHGYPDAKINELLEKIPDEMGYTLIEFLQEKFFKIIQDNEIALE